jgi:hypothetical protein
MRHEKRYDSVWYRNCFRPTTVVLATVLVMATALSAQDVVDFGRHCSTCDNSKGRHSQIAPMLTLPIWLNHQRLELGVVRSNSLNSFESIVTASVQPPPGKGGCTYDCGPTILGPQRKRRGSPLVTSAG